MTENKFDHLPDPELAAALRAALEPADNQAAFVAGVMARYDEALERATIPAWEVLAAWSRPGIAAAVAAALISGFMFGRTLISRNGSIAGETPAAIDAAMAPAEGPGFAALVMASDPPDASVVLTSLVEPQ
jgi:hypothetical protein